MDIAHQIGNFRNFISINNNFLEPAVRQIPLCGIEIILPTEDTLTYTLRSLPEEIKSIVF